MSLLDDYAFSLKVSRHVLDFIHKAGRKWEEGAIIIPFFNDRTSITLGEFTEKFNEYSNLKEKVFIQLGEFLSSIEQDKNSPKVIASEIIEIHDRCHQLSEMIGDSCEKFLEIQKISKKVGFFAREVHYAIRDFSNVESQLFLRIKNEFYVIIRDWMAHHERELKSLNNHIEGIGKELSNERGVLELQSKRLESYIESIGKNLSV